MLPLSAYVGCMASVSFVMRGPKRSFEGRFCGMSKQRFVDMDAFSFVFVFALLTYIIMCLFVCLLLPMRTQKRHACVHHTGTH